jgi:DNA-binding response OmpR family regulator
MVMKTVLVCDDMPEFTHMMYDTLLSAGKYRVDIVSTAEAADALLRYIYYDIVIMDRAFPGMPGGYPAQIARRKGSFVVGVTGHLPDSDRFNESVDHLFMKPFKPQDLLSMISNRLEEPMSLCGVCLGDPCACIGGS